MDFPKSVPNVGLVNGQFADENVVTGQPGSLIPAAWGNSVTQEILNVIKDGGLAPSEADLTQLSKAIKAISKIDQATEAKLGLVKLATVQQVLAGADDTAAITSSKLKAKSQSSALDVTTGSLLTPGAFGVGGVSPAFPGNDLNTLVPYSATFGTGAGCLNAPPGWTVQGSVVKHDVWQSAGAAQQTFLEHITGRTARRALNDGRWSGWLEMLASENLPSASETVAGIAQVASQAEVTTGTSDSKFVTPKKLAGWAKQATSSILGLVKLATDTQVQAGADNAAAITPLTLRNRSQSTPIDTTAGCLLTPGAFGLGGNAVDFPGNDLSNTTVPSALYRTSTGALNAPLGVTVQGSLVRHEVWNNGVVQQTFLEHITARHFRRACNSGTWSAWDEVVQGITGAVVAFAVNSPPTGWLTCNGGAFSRTTYATLFARIGTTFGSGDGSTTFNIPDLRGEFLRGVDAARGVNPGRVFGSLELDALQGHGHINTIHTANGPPGGGGEYVGAGAPGAIQVSGRVLDPVALNSGTPRIANETRSRNVALLFCIKY